MVSYSGYGAGFIPRLLEEKHSVDYTLIENEGNFDKVLSGIIPKPLKKQPNFKNYDLVIFDLTGNGASADIIRVDAPVIGDGSFQEAIEDDRLLGIELMQQCGINVPPYECFENLNEAKSYIKKSGKRYVFKPFGGQDQSCDTTYVSKSAEDLLSYIDRLGQETKGARFILQEFIEGTEISTEAYFNGEEFFFINGTLEEKKLLNDNLGPNNGCSGNLVWAYNGGTGTPQIFNWGLGKTKDMLKQVNFRGMIDLNTIVTDRQIYGIEWTPRFGYDASYTLFNLLSSSLGDFLGSLSVGARPEYEVKGAFAAGIRLSIPPYPSEIEGAYKEDVPIEGINPEDCIRDCYLYDAMIKKGELVTAGVSGFIAVPVCKADSPENAFGKCYERVKRIQIPNMQYRTDLDKKILKRYKTLQNQGWLTP